MDRGEEEKKEKSQHASDQLDMDHLSRQFVFKKQVRVRLADYDAARNGAAAANSKRRKAHSRKKAHRPVSRADSDSHEAASESHANAVIESRGTWSNIGVL